MSNTTLKQVSAIALLVLGSCTMAQASINSLVATTDADITFGGTDTASITITPVAGLQAGAAIPQTKVADGQVTSTGTGNFIAYKWDAATGVVDTSGTGKGKDTVLVNGKYNSANQVTFVTSSADAAPSGIDDAWFVSKVAAPTMNFIISTTAAAEDVKVDVYPVKMDAAIWLP